MSALIDRHELKETLRRKKAAPAANKHPVNQAAYDDRDFGERVADQLAGGMGSWTFVIVQTIFMIAWVATNVIWLLNRGWDPYPFILLNLALSLQATYAGPIVLLAGNRHAQHDRLRLEHTAAVEEAAERVTFEILKEIERNTECTLKVAEHIRRRHTEFHGPVPPPTG